MNMHHGRLAPAAVAAVLATTIGASYVARYGLDADFAHDGIALGWLVAMVLVPAIGAIAFDALQGRRQSPVPMRAGPTIDMRFAPTSEIIEPVGAIAAAARTIVRPVAEPAEAVESAAVPAEAIVEPVAAHAAADIPSLTEVRVERRQRERRGAPAVKTPATV